MTPTRYFMREFRPDLWHVCDRENGNQPIHDDSPFGDDKALVFDYDNASRTIDELNLKQELE